ncbi:MAG: phosphatidylglycerol lysyltransferase [Spirochaetales bacterium]|jgi:phosphoglucomutase|nr:phosphatidylglycerol lysyltransferase [Spirochaetales bacterium]
MIHPETGFFLGDPYAPPFPAGYTGDPAARAAAMERFILSASGWRSVFAADGDDESRTEDITLTAKEIAAAIAQTFADFILRRFSASGGPCLAVGIDSRFTGPRIAEIMIRVFLLRGLQLRYLFITPAPEIMAWTGMDADIHGFAYISASHNPIGHNGVKFGLGGGVLEADEVLPLADNFKALAADNGRMRELIQELSASAAQSDFTKQLESVFRETSRWKKEAQAAYESFILHVITGSGKDELEQQKTVLGILRKEIRSRGCGLVIDFNGSARTLGIDTAFLEGFGIRLKTINARPREITHTIEPEGEALELCRARLEEAHAKDSRFIFGYVPDHDGDRGNIVLWDDSAGGARIPSAQEVFALACYAELAFLAWQNGGSVPAKTAIAVNDPTSLRIERIAESFGARVFRAEVGEANVVSLAKKLRAEGWTVRILGEGSNGGNITWPSRVRDPLSTVFALLKLLYLPLFPSSPQATLSEITGALPRFLTLSTSAKEARLAITTKDHSILKARYENIFLREWEARKKALADFGITSWEELNHEGIICRSGMGASCRTKKQRGGLTLLLKNSEGKAVAFLWMRGSGTEDTFRISVDVEGAGKTLFDYLLLWQTALVREADTS